MFCKTLIGLVVSDIACFGICDKNGGQKIVSSFQNNMNNTCWSFVVVYDKKIIPLAAPE